MRPLTLDDLLPLEEYAPKRREFQAALRRYLDGQRRVRLGPRITLLFENRQTLWFRIQEIIRVLRLTDPEQINDQLALYNRLLPGPDALQAALLIDIADEARLRDELAFWNHLAGDDIKLCLGDHCYPAHILTSRPEDRAVGAAHWVQFRLDGDGKKKLANLRQPAWLAIDRDVYRHQSAPFGEEVRQSLAEDLALSEKDAA